MLQLLSISLVLLLVLTVIKGQTIEGHWNKSPDEAMITSQLNKALPLAINETLLLDESHYNGNGTFEDQEDFQWQEWNPNYSKCEEQLLEEYGRTLCWVRMFHDNMMRLGEQNWCNWEMVLRHYNNLTHCLELTAHFSQCPYPNRVVQDLFVEVHRHYFSSCESADEDLSDAPEALVIFLTLLPVSIIPVLVYAVLYKSAVRD